MKTKINEHPIIFNTEMVRAILDGRKTQTRIEDRGQCPYSVGDMLWVRETWRLSIMKRVGYFAEYKDGQSVCLEGLASVGELTRFRLDVWQSSTHMPRWASRITLRIKSIRPQRLGDISEEDAKAEGISDGGCIKCGSTEASHPVDGDPHYPWYPCKKAKPDYPDAFFRLFWKIRRSRGPLLDNPWLWVIEFERLANPETGGGGE